MKKILITGNNVNEYIEGNQLYIKKNMIVSPGVFDILRSKNVEIIYDSKEEVCPIDQVEEGRDISNENQLENRIEEILKMEHNVVDKAVISNIQKSILNILVK